MSLKKIYNHLSGKNLERLRNVGMHQQKKVNNLKKDLNWVQKNVTQKSKYKGEIDRLQNLDIKYDAAKDKLFRDRVIGTTAVGAPAGGALYAAISEKTASTSRLMNILKGTRKKAIDRRLGQIEKKMDAARVNPNISDKRNIELSKHHDKLRREGLKEKSLRIGAYGSLASIPVLGAGYGLQKESAMDLGTKVIMGSILSGGGIGAGLNLADKDIENSLSNISQSTALGAGAAAVPGLIALTAKKNPKLRRAIEELYNRSKR